MLETDVYKPLNDFLKLKGFEIVDISVEKVGMLPAKGLLDDGVNSNDFVSLMGNVRSCFVAVQCNLFSGHSDLAILI